LARGNEEVTVAMETTTNWQATARAAACGAVVPMSGAMRVGSNSGFALLPLQKLSITGYVRPVTAAFTADEHAVRTWSPPV
jgi:hypothetical protein